MKKFISTILSLLTYIWTYYLVYQMINYITEIEILIHTYKDKTPNVAV